MTIRIDGFFLPSIITVSLTRKGDETMKENLKGEQLLISNVITISELYIWSRKSFLLDTTYSLPY
jgi:hypothetical protein